MTHTLPDTSSPTAPAKPALKRRGMLLGATAVAGVAAAVAAKVLPGSKATPEVAATGAAKPGEAGGGYRLTAHVQRYYETTRT
jgi:hypothetical protein